MEKPKTRDKYKYDFTVDLENKNHPLTKIYNFIPPGCRVLDFGCATGYFAEVLHREKNCSVTGMEINKSAAEVASKFCERVIVADLNQINLKNELGEELFDVMVFADILEHLVDPHNLLVKARNHLKDEGMVLCSIPNIAHWSIRLELLSGSFDYQEFGLLDNTHLRFFTKKSIIHELERSGYYVEQVDRVIQGLDIEKLDPFPEDMRGYLIAWLANDSEHDTFQYIIKARQATERNRLAELHGQLQSLEAMLETLKGEIKIKEAEIEKLSGQVVALTQWKYRLADIARKIARKILNK